MKRSDLEDLIESTFESVKKINGSKGKEYATDEESLANFYNRAAEFGVDPKVVCGIFLGKHLDAINAYIKTGAVLSEGIEGRVQDAILYLVLLLGLIEDDKADQQDVDDFVHRAATSPPFRAYLENILEQSAPAAPAGEDQMALDVEAAMGRAVGSPNTQYVDGELREPDQQQTLDELREKFLPIEGDAVAAARLNATDDTAVLAMVPNGDPVYNQGIGYSDSPRPEDHVA